MRIETIQDGVVIEVQEVEGHFLPPNFSQFYTSIIFNPAYLRLMESLRGKEVRSTIELLSVRLELKNNITDDDLYLYKVVWDQIIDSAAIAFFTAEEIQDLNSKAEAARMPFRFAEDSKLVLLSVPPQ